MIRRYLLKESFYLQTTGKLMLQGSYFSTEDEAVITEMEKFAKDGSCVEHVSKPAEQPQKGTETPPGDDISEVKGVGAALVKKLSEKGINTKSGLGAALSDKSREEEMKEILGKSHKKVLEQFVSA